MYRSIRDYVSEGSDVSYGQLIKRFGAPETIVAAYVAEMEERELLANLKVGKKLISVVSAAVIATFLLCIGCIAACYVDHSNDVNGYAVVEIIEADRITNVTGG